MEFNNKISDANSTFWDCYLHNYITGSVQCSTLRNIYLFGGSLKMMRMIFRIISFIVLTSFLLPFLGSEGNKHVPYYECSDMEIGIESSSEIAQNETLPPVTPPVADELILQPPTLSAASGADDVINGQVPVDSEHLDEDILTLLGDAPKEETLVGKNIHVDIALRLQDVLQNGLKKEQKTKIMDEYPTPGNCQLFMAPILNPEVKAAISEVLLKKDASLAARQGQVGVALSALTSVMDILVNEKSETNQTLLKHVNNVCRILCDSHYIDTKLRRNFLISTLSNKLKETLKESKRDKHLFGESLPESLRATKAITKTSQDLKSYIAKPKPTTKYNNRPTSSTNNLNWKHPQSNHQANPQNMNRKMTSATVHRTAGYSSIAHRNETTRNSTSARANRTNVPYKNQRRQ